MESNETTIWLLSNWSYTTTEPSTITSTESPSTIFNSTTPSSTLPSSITTILSSPTTLLSTILSTPTPNHHLHPHNLLRNISSSYKPVTSFSPAVVHFTYYELNFLDILFFACVFFLKFFITSLFLIFALVAINGNSYPQLIARSSEAHRLVANSSDTPRNGNEKRRRRRDLLYTMAALSIISGNVSCFLAYIAALQRFLYIYNWRQRGEVLKNLLTSWAKCKSNQHRSETEEDLLDQGEPETPVRPLVANGGVSVHFSPKRMTSYNDKESGRHTPKVVFIDYEPDIERTSMTTPPLLPVTPSTSTTTAITIESSLNTIETGSTTYSPILRIRVVNPNDGSSLITRARLEPHSVCSYLCPTIATTLRLRRHYIWPVFYRSHPAYVHQATTAFLQSTEPVEGQEEGSFHQSLSRNSSSSYIKPHSSEAVELLIPSQSGKFHFSPAPKPGSWIAFLAQNTCGICLSDAPEAAEPFSTGNDHEIGLIIGQDLLYRLMVPSSTPTHRVYLIGRQLAFVRTAFGWAVSGSSEGLSLGSELKVRQIETAHLGISEVHGEGGKRRRSCTDTMRILCCPLQILVSLLVLLIYILIPYIDSLLYLYNILFHLAITFALAQLLAFILAPLFTLFQCFLTSPNAPTSLLSTLKANILLTYAFLCKPLLFIYGWHLGAIWVSLYWFLSMGKALFGQWNASPLECKHAIRFSANFTLKSVDTFAAESGSEIVGQGAHGHLLSPSIHIRIEPGAEQSSLSADLLTSDTFKRLLSECCPANRPEVPKSIRKVVNSLTLPALKDPTLLPVQLTTDREIVFKVVQPDPNDLPHHSWIALGADTLDALSTEHSLNRLIRSMLLFDTSALERPENPQTNPLEVTLENCSEPSGPWALQQRFYPYGWLQVLSCTYWFKRENFLYLFFFLGYSFLLAVVYFCLIVPHELTLISLRPTMFRYIGNFLLYSVRWAS